MAGQEWKNMGDAGRSGRALVSVRAFSAKKVDSVHHMGILHTPYVAVLLPGGAIGLYTGAEAGNRVDNPNSLAFPSLCEDPLRRQLTCLFGPWGVTCGCSAAPVIKREP